MTDPADHRELHADRVRFTRGRRLIIDDVDCTVPGGGFRSCWPIIRSQHVREGNSRSLLR